MVVRERLPELMEFIIDPNLIRHPGRQYSGQEAYNDIFFVHSFSLDVRRPLDVGHPLYHLYKLYSYRRWL
jgi:hypothetical protein